MKLEILFQFIVPLVFLAIWALTSLLNRDAQPLPQRPRRPGDRPGPEQAGGLGANRGTAPPGTERASAPRDGAARPQGPPPGRLDDASVYIIDDEVVFVDPSTNRRIMSAPIRNAAATESSRGEPKPQKSSQGRKGGRSRRPPASNGEVRPAPETRRALSDQVGRSMSISRGKPLVLAPLTSKLTPLTGSMISTAPSRDLGLERASSGPVLQASEIKNMLASPLKLREAVLLSEVLQSPVSLRRRLRSR